MRVVTSKDREQYDLDTRYTHFSAEESRVVIEDIAGILKWDRLPSLSDKVTVQLIHLCKIRKAAPGEVATVPG